VDEFTISDREYTDDDPWFGKGCETGRQDQRRQPH
jgi:hypothetical protein